MAVTSIAQETQQQKSTLAEADHLQIAAQKICPVTGEALGSMGEPLKVKVGEQVAYLCCKGCQGKQLNAEHWKTIQTNLAAAQGTCPIMGKPVDATMKSTVVNGQQVFVCCPPCIPKIQADVEGSLKKGQRQLRFLCRKGTTGSKRSASCDCSRHLPCFWWQAWVDGRSDQSQSWRRRNCLPLLQRLRWQAAQRRTLDDDSKQPGDCSRNLPSHGQSG